MIFILRYIVLIKKIAADLYRLNVFSSLGSATHGIEINIFIRWSDLYIYTKESSQVRGDGSQTTQTGVQQSVLAQLAGGGNVRLVEREAVKLLSAAVPGHEFSYMTE